LIPIGDGCQLLGQQRDDLKQIADNVVITREFNKMVDEILKLTETSFSAPSNQASVQAS
jgi:hypothetical protein